ncbi:glycosyltransferase family 2 protein [Methanobacterium petrolearium]|uniref:glycosyltransferase family 2 protein n=1 Tax=Methanobacterium petrolearium TaxID=710190 RepID=UPI001FD7F619|nr:glycosyltransferase family 2 protein [Methanobacterium petrolearium]MBP1945331.1 glycosyltransferase involved in cell wall biosynthesis [Methanobacterium petrolearium]BDZ71513.1 dolichyl-phosphate mannose synthase [Methanobacterium petrolearium]
MTNETEQFLKKYGKKIFIVMPAFNESKTIENVMEELLLQGLQLVVVDDGSHDKTPFLVERVQKKYPEQVRLYRHPINRGLGAAIRTGVEACILEDPHVIVTFDADGQHHVDDLLPVIKPVIEDDADVVIGIRDFHVMPFRKKFGNVVMNIITSIFYRISVNDSQSGLRALSLDAAKNIELHSRDYGVSSELIGEVKRKQLKLVEVPIETIYTDYSLSKGTDTRIGLKILAKLIKNIFK